MKHPLEINFTHSMIILGVPYDEIKTIKINI